MGVISDDDEWGLNDLLDERDRQPQHVLSADDLAAVQALLDGMDFSVEKDKLGNPTDTGSTQLDAEKDLSGKGFSKSDEAIEDEGVSSVSPAPLSPLLSSPSSTSPDDHHASTTSTTTSTTTPDHETASPDTMKLVRASREKFASKYSAKPAPLKTRRKASKVIHRTQPEWEDLSLYEKINQHHQTISTFGHVNAFTLNLTPENELRARRSIREGQREPNPLDWVHRRIREELRLLGLPSEFWSIIEEAPVDHDNRPAREAVGLPGNLRAHIHGEIICAPEYAERVRKALRRAGGEWDDCRQFQTKLVLEPNDGWVAYTTKDQHKHQAFMKRLQVVDGLCGSAITGSLFSATRKLGKDARDSYDHWRATENVKRRAKALAKKRA